MKEKAKFSVCTDSSIEGRLDSAKLLGKENRATLGLFPDGAFDEYAHKGRIVYLLDRDRVCGYLLFRLAKGRAAIAHICVDEDYRGRGGARFLFDGFRKIVDDGFCRGIEVRCRRDYDVASLWPKLNFQFVKYVAGRGKDPKELGVWFFHFDTEDFFHDMMPKQDEDDLVWAVLDANVVFKLNTPDATESQEASALISETTSPYARYFVTSEIFTEIARKKDTAQHKKSLSFAKSFEKLEPKRSHLDETEIALAPLWGPISSERDQSDFRHVVNTIAAGHQIFITQDDGILQKKDSVYENFGLRILRPVEFIVELDQLENAERYNPKSVVRTEFQSFCPTLSDLEKLADAFHQPHTGEKRKQFIARLRSSIANTDKYKTVTVQNGKGEPKLLIVFQPATDRLSIELLRHDDSTAAKTLAKNLVAAEAASTEFGNLRLIELIDQFTEAPTRALFSDVGTISTPSGWVRLSANITAPQEIALGKIEDFLKRSQAVPEIHERSFANALFSQTASVSNLEEAFSPLKIEDADIPCYLIPIKPIWALHLFDTTLANQELWGADPLRHFNLENVYYRSPNPLKTQPGARILWYVSQDNGLKISEIRACSRLISSEIDTAKSLYSKYKHLGIYEWRDLMKTTNQDAYGKIMAIRFHQTECLKRPIRLNDFNDFKINGAPQSPRTLSPSQFILIYKAGMNINE